MFETITETRLTPVELEVDAEFVLAAAEEPLVEADLLVEDISFGGTSEAPAPV